LLRGTLGTRSHTSQDLEVGDVALEKQHQLAWRRVESGPQRDERPDGLTPALVRHADHRRLGNRGVFAQRVFHFGGIDVLSRDDDGVLDAIGDEDVAVGVERAGVAGAEPAVDQGIRGHFRQAPVFDHDGRRLVQIADDPGATLAPLIDNLISTPGRGRPAARNNGLPRMVARRQTRGIAARQP
jgi:hypothetical protein